MKYIESFPPVINGESRILILGSMPGEESIRLQQYYAHRRNHFWRIIYSLFGYKPDESYGKRKLFLLSKKIALWDVIHSCSRSGSLDTAIRNEEPNDIIKLVSDYSGIVSIFFNGAKAESSFRKHISTGLRGDIYRHRLPSTSPAYTVSIEKKIDEWSIIRRYLVN